MKTTAALLLCIFMAFGAMAQEKQLVTVKRSFRLMGSDFEITLVAQNEEIGYINIEEAVAEVGRIEKLISSWDPDSETSRINQNAGIKPVKVSYELFKLIERAKQISEITFGAFDISYAPINDLWKFDGSMRYVPEEAAIKEVLSKVGHRKIVLDTREQTVYLKEAGMRINFGAIGKGYAADKAKELLISKQVPAGMINAAGDITTWGTKATGEKWLLGIANPEGSKIVTWVPLVESSVAISGNVDRFITLNGKRYSHLINPLTGYPVSGIRKVTVFSKTAELCDALATAVFILGKTSGMALINQLGGTEAIVQDDENKIYTSNGLLIDIN